MIQLIAQILLQVLSLLVAYLIARVLWNRWKYDLHKIPSPSGRLPIVGHALEFVKGGNVELTELRGRWFKELNYPKIMKAQLMNRTVVYVRDLETVRSVVLNKTDPFPKSPFNPGGVMRMVGNDVSAKAFFSTPAITPYVKSIRKLYAAAFTSAGLKQKLPKLNRVLDKMIEIVENKRESGPIDFQKLCVKMTLDAIGSAAFDYNLGGLDGSGNLYQLIIDVGHLRPAGFNPFKSLYRKWFPNSDEAAKRSAKINALTAEWDKLANDVLNREDPPSGEEPLWHGLKTMVNPDTGKPLEYKDLRCELGMVVVAGMDTTGHQLGWILALLASNPRVIDTLLKELKEHGLYGPSAREVTFEDLGDLTYLTAIIKEGMRIASVVTGLILRVVPRDMSIMGYRVPKGTFVTVPSNRWLDCEAEWGDPKIFRPERWLGDEDMSQKLYFGFSFGPRDCAGQRLAMTEMRMAIIKLVSKYKFSMDTPMENLMKNSRNGIAIEARDGVWLSVSPRPVENEDI